MVTTDITHKNGAALLHILHVNHNFDLLRLLPKKVRHHTFVVFFHCLHRLYYGAYVYIQWLCIMSWQLRAMYAFDGG